MSNITSQSELTTKEIVEQAISDYHESILPYLNGMVPTIANKFDKANLYSTDEKIIGRWIDGKPLYQKTFTGLNLEISQTSFTDSNIPATNVNDVIMCIGCDENGTYMGGFLVSTFGKGTKSSSFGIQTTRNNAPVIVSTLTLQYTKTTDEAIAIGSDTDYSTTEKIIGTWTDGKPLYQKTVIISSDSYDLTSLSVEHIHLVNMVTNDSATVRLFDSNYFSDTDWFRLVYANNTLLKQKGTSGTMPEVIATIQYTKTTDV